MDPLGLEFLYATNDTRGVGIINKISQTNYGKDPNSAFGRIQNDPNAKVLVMSDGNFSSFNPSDPNYYGMPVIRISDSDTVNNNNYVLSDGKGAVSYTHLYTYDDNFRLKTIQTFDAKNKLLGGVEYVWDSDGTLKGKNIWE